MTGTEKETETERENGQWRKYATSAAIGLAWWRGEEYVREEGEDEVGSKVTGVGKGRGEEYHKDEQG